jgi:Transposase
VINPKQARDFARAILAPTTAPYGLLDPTAAPVGPGSLGSLGKHAKTDAIDAVMLAEFAARMRPNITVPSSEHMRALEAITSRRRQLLEMLTSDHARKVHG